MLNTMPHFDFLFIIVELTIGKKRKINEAKADFKMAVPKSDTLYSQVPKCKKPRKSSMPAGKSIVNSF